MRRFVCALGVASALAACASVPGLEPPPSGIARVVIPPLAIAGAPFTASTPFTNSIPYESRSLLALAAVPPQVLEVVDPLTGAVLARQTVVAGASLVLPQVPSTAVLLLQVCLRDAQGGLHGVLATPWRAGDGSPHVLSPGSTVAPLAAALAVDAEHPPTMGEGFAGRARRVEARMLAMVSQQAGDRAIAAYDPLLAREGDGQELMAAIAAQAGRVAAAIASPSSSPESLGLRLGEVLGAPAPTPVPAPVAAVPWIGRGPAIPSSLPVR